MAKKKTADSSPTETPALAANTDPQAQKPRLRKRTPTPRTSSAAEGAARAAAAGQSGATPLSSGSAPISVSPAAGGNGAVHGAPTYEQIAEAAYQRYLQRGGNHGNDLEDWIEAERELRARR